MGTVSGPHGLLEAYYVKRLIEKKKEKEIKKEKESKVNQNKSR